MRHARLEIRAAEGGLDSRVFVTELGNAYSCQAERLGWSLG